MLLREHLLSVDMANKIDQSLSLRKHYSSKQRDYFSRLGSDDVPQEKFYNYYLSRIKVDYDEYSSVLVVSASSFDPSISQKIVAALVSEGERYMNELGHRLARNQMSFLELQVRDKSEALKRARMSLIKFQNEKKMFSPGVVAQSVAASIEKIQGQLIEIQSKKSSLLQYMSDKAPQISELDFQIKALEEQIKKLQSKLVSDDSGLNKTLEEYQLLEAEEKFAGDLYKTALVALERGRIESVRTLKNISVIQSPTKPEMSEEPRRLYNIVLTIVVLTLVLGIVRLVSLIVNE